MAYTDRYGVDYGPKYTCANCHQPSGMMGHYSIGNDGGAGFSCVRPLELLEGDRARAMETDLIRMRYLNLREARRELSDFATRRNRRERQWRRLRDSCGILRKIARCAAGPKVFPNGRVFAINRLERMQRQDGVRPWPR